MTRGGLLGIAVLIVGALVSVFFVDKWVRRGPPQYSESHAEKCIDAGFFMGGMYVSHRVCEPAKEDDE